MSGASTSVRVSAETLHELEYLRKTWHVTSADETIRKLIKERRAKALTRLQGSQKHLPPFQEKDRLVTHY